jgi:hypothetical protein
MAERDHGVAPKWRLEGAVANLKVVRVSAVSRLASVQRETDVMRLRPLSTPRKRPSLSPSDESVCSASAGIWADDARDDASRAGSSLVRGIEGTHADKAVGEGDKTAKRVAILNGIVGRPLKRGQRVASIPSRATGIAKGAFSACRGLRAVRFANDSALTEIGEESFMGCQRLETIDLPSSVKWIGQMAFCRCVRLSSVSIGRPSSLMEISVGAFRWCVELREVVIPSSVRTIGAGAFRHCVELALLTMEQPMDSALREVGREAFCECSSLPEVTLPSNVRSIGGYAFGGCSSLVRFIASPGSLLMDVGEMAFAGCTSLADVVVPARIRPLAVAAFGATTRITYMASLLHDT